MEPLLSIACLNKFISSPGPSLHVLKDINLQIEKGEFLVILGHSGSGKSTLLNILGCLDVPTSGVYKIDGVELSSLSNNELARLRSKMFGFVFQRYNLLPQLTALENVALPGVYKGLSKQQRLHRANSLLSQFGLEDKLSNKPNQLSGGQQQRISIARALMNQGSILLADEPTGALDSQNGQTVLDTFLRIRQLGTTIIFVTHNRKIAEYADRIIELQDGRIIREQINNKPPYYKPSPLNVNQLESHEKSSRICITLVECLFLSLQAISAHKLRSALTMIGIIIGIASVILVMALGEGSKEKILKEVQSIGENTISIYPGDNFGDINASRFNSLKFEDINILSKQLYVSGASPVITIHNTARTNNMIANVTAIAVNESYFSIRSLELAEGRFFTASDMKQHASIAIIDQRARQSLFSASTTPIGQIVLFENRPVEVIGVLRDSKMQHIDLDKPNIFLPYTTVALKISKAVRPSSILVKIKDNIISQVAEKDITTLLLTIRNGKKDFFTFSTNSIKNIVEKTQKTMTLLIASIALISLIVGGIGVMNILLVSISERTSEIGLRMSIGATSQDVLAQFLFESVFICLLGGGIGLLGSIIILPLINHFFIDFIAHITLDSAIIAVSSTSIIGILFGFLPARKASQLNPIDALRRE